MGEEEEEEGADQDDEVDEGCASRMLGGCGSGFKTRESESLGLVTAIYEKESKVLVRRGGEK